MGDVEHLFILNLSSTLGLCISLNRGEPFHPAFELFPFPSPSLFVFALLIWYLEQLRFKPKILQIQLPSIYGVVCIVCISQNNRFLICNYIFVNCWIQQLFGHKFQNMWFFVMFDWIVNKRFGEGEAWFNNNSIFFFLEFSGSWGFSPSCSNLCVFAIVVVVTTIWMIHF